MPGFYDITPFSLLDYPGEMACIAWFAGCNMRCVYCHNPQIVNGKSTKDESELIAFLEKRTGRLGGVVFSGGEATLSPGLPDLMRRVKAMGFKIKLDTNGTRPEVLRELLRENLLDYVAMDYKSPRDRMQDIIGSVKLWEPFRESLTMMIGATMKTSALTFEVRTTVPADHLTPSEINWIINDLDQLGFKGTYYVQNVFSFGEKTIGNIEKPSRELDRSKLVKPKGFTLGYRNFGERE